MPSAGDVVGEARIRFVLARRLDLAEPLRAALRRSSARIPPRACGARARRAGHHAALVQVVVFGYYTDAGVRERLGYPGQVAKTLYSWKVPDFIEEGLIDKVLARGPVWKDPVTGRIAEPGAQLSRETT